MVKHIVTFKLKGTTDLRREIAGQFRDALLALPAKISVIRNIEVGLNENPSEDWDIVLTVTVDRMEDVAAYANHPAHLAAAAIVGPHKESRACVDYSI